MSLLNWKYLLSVAAAVVISVAVAMRDTGPSWEKHASAVSYAATSLCGAATGTGVFFLLSRWIKAWPVRILSAVVSGPLGVVAGVLSGFLIACQVWNGLVFGPHGYRDDTDYLWIVLYSMRPAIPSAIVFGLGPGLSIRKKQETQ